MSIKKSVKTLHPKNIDTPSPALDPRAIPPGVLQEDPLMIDAIVIENIHPEIDQGRFAVKAVVGELVRVQADIFKDGHDKLGASLKYRIAGQSGWNESRMKDLGNDRWEGCFTPVENAYYEYSIEAWVDVTGTWARDISKKCAVYPDVQNDTDQGVIYLRQLMKQLPESRRKELSVDVQKLELSAGASDEVVGIISGDGFKSILDKFPLKDKVTLAHPLELFVDRRRAEYAAWYEMFPRSQGTVPNKSGTFKDCINRLPDIKKMGFNVIYLPPIHPIGKTNRKGPNNSLITGKNSPGSPWAIGSKEGGHKSIHPDLGTEQDFEDFVEAAADYGIEIALDFAVQCSPDHPYVKAHAEWFIHQPDGTIKYAENPPKKYQDIYPLNFFCANHMELWNELKSIVEFWIEKGVKTFRVDNPHTKPLQFWEWLIRGIRASHPEVIFLAEAFTRPAVMKYLAKAGFTQSYTYFTWRNYRDELCQYFEELTQSDMKYYFRGNLFANTPDILTDILQHGGKPAFKMRLVLAATLSSVYGIYSGYELCEHKAVEQGSEEYLDSEKYQYKVWDWNREGNIKDFVSRINHIRTQNIALHGYKNLELYGSNNPNIFCFGKRTPDNSNIIVVVVNLDPYHVQEDTVHLPIWKFGIEDWQTYQAKDLITGEKYYWRGQHNYVRLDPHYQPAHILRIKK